MVSITEVQTSNSRLSSTFPAGLVAVFVGATAGIGEFAMKEFAHRASKPRIYFVGRSQKKADRILGELKVLNREGQYIFLQADTSLMQSVDDICQQIKSKEKTVNVLFMSQGTLKMGTSTSEGLHYVMAVTYYGRTRFIMNLLPLLRAAQGLRRVVSVMAGSYEGEVFRDDWQGWKVPMMAGRGHMSSMLTLAHQQFSKQAPEVSFVQNYPGAVKTDILRGNEGIMVILFCVLVFPVMMLLGKLPVVSQKDCGDRQTYFCTSGKYPAGKDAKDGDGVQLLDGNTRALGVDGEAGSGVYSLFWDGEIGEHSKTVEVTRGHNESRLGDALWEHTTAEFGRITGKANGLE